VESSPVSRSSGRRGRRREWPWIALTISIAVHVVLVLMSSVEGRQPVLPRRPRHIVVLPPLAERSRAVEMPYRTAPIQPTVPGREPVRHPRRLPENPPVTVLPPPPVTHPRTDSGVVALLEPVTPDRIGPSWADGLLWVRPLPLPARELAQRLRKTDAELADSVVKATIQAFLDSIAREPDATKATLPEWSTQIAGKKFGIDQKYLTVAGLKIPAAVLALIPLHGGYNESKVFDRTDELLADLRYAATRAQTVDAFKHAISEMRRRKQEEHDFERNQRSAPPPELRSPPPVPVVTQATPDTAAERPQ
jgi:hypothetical protein